MLLPKLPFVVLDTETTGLTPRVDHVVEFALVRYEGGEKVAEYESLYTIDGAMSDVSRALTRINPEDLQKQPRFSDEQGKIEKLLEGVVIVGQNILFDLEMLKGEGMDLLERPWIDSAMLASIVYPELKSYSLSYLSAVLELPHDPVHRAMGDVHATTALIEKAWGRLQEMPKNLAEQIKAMAEKGPEGYANFFASLSEVGRENSEWLKNFKSQNSKSQKNLKLQIPNEANGRVWFAVKNLDITLRDSDTSDYEPVFSPNFLLNPKAAQALQAQDSFTADELTVALKLMLYAPKHHSDFPLHGGERDVWKGKLACTKESEAYCRQFESEKHVILEHRHLLELVERREGPKAGDAVVIADASMLEDTATKAFKWSCSIDPLRAAAEGNEELTSFLDAYQIWLEKVRNFQDVRYVVETDLMTKEAKGLRERLNAILQTNLNDQTKESLIELQNILNPQNLAGRIAYISQFRDGAQILQSIPLDIAGKLNATLYEFFTTTLLLPPGDETSFTAIIPPGAEVTNETEELSAKPFLRYTEPEFTIDRLLPRVDGKVVCLVTSKRTIEQLYVKFAEPLEKEGITLIAQGVSGGMGRMQAEFLTTPDRAVWMITPWMYEGVDLPPETVDHLWIHTLPFDHPSHAVLSLRAEKFGRSAFDFYFIPRLLHRLFRLLRKYVNHRKSDGDVLVLDQRLQTKNYGERVMEYLHQFTTASPSRSKPDR